MNLDPRLARAREHIVRTGLDVLECNTAQLKILYAPYTGDLSKAEVCKDINRWKVRERALRKKKMLKDLHQAIIDNDVLIARLRAEVNELERMAVPLI